VRPHARTRLRRKGEDKRRQKPRRYHIWYNGPTAWSIETLDETIDAEFSALSPDLRARFVRIAELIEAVGLPNVREPHVKHVRGPIWELRLKGKAGTARALYVAARGQRVVVVRVFVKKAQKTPASEIERALRRGQELET
jgi:phage-related protein